MPLECALFYSNGIKGSNTKKGRPESSVVIEFEHKVYSPLDAQRGIYTGARVHEPVVVIKEIDTASPQLYQACCTGQTLDELTIKWYEIKNTGVEEQYFQHTLRNVKVASVEDVLPNTKETIHEKKRHLEKVRLMYEQIGWVHSDGYEFEDSWMEKSA